jgi:glutathione synthase/RimK-type ligase-like ATP-grasp enzyme
VGVPRRISLLRVALATSARWPQLAPEESSLIPELASRGLDARPAVWSDPSIDWSQFDRVVIRSCWDYHRRLDEFLRWIDLVPSLCNPAHVIRWNSHKSYLLELAKKGVRIPRTALMTRGVAEDVDPAMTAGRLIVKPAVSASAYETHLFDSFDEARGIVGRLASDHDVIIQEFVPEVVEEGEWSLIYFARQFSHAVHKAPKSGDFRVQQEHGGSASHGKASPGLLRAAESALNMVEGELCYARVDLVDTSRGPLLMELELIEPSLFLATDPDATRRFADAIVHATPRAKSKR